MSLNPDCWSTDNRKFQSSVSNAFLISIFGARLPAKLFFDKTLIASDVIITQSAIL
jgi:hypothetical protein